jgi:hypothetical protein
VVVEIHEETRRGRPSRCVHRSCPSPRSASSSYACRLTSSCSCRRVVLVLRESSLVVRDCARDDDARRRTSRSALTDVAYVKYYSAFYGLWPCLKEQMHADGAEPEDADAPRAALGIRRRSTCGLVLQAADGEVAHITLDPTKTTICACCRSVDGARGAGGNPRDECDHGSGHRAPVRAVSAPGPMNVAR